MSFRLFFVLFAALGLAACATETDPAVDGVDTTMVEDEPIVEPLPMDTTMMDTTMMDTTMTDTTGL